MVRYSLVTGFDPRREKCDSVRRSPVRTRGFSLGPSHFNGHTTPLHTPSFSIGSVTCFIMNVNVKFKKHRMLIYLEFHGASYDINHRMLRGTLETIAYPLCLIFNLSLRKFLISIHVGTCQYNAYF